MTYPHQKTYRIRSFVRRDGRLTAAQEEAHRMLWPSFGLALAQGMLDFTQVFKRQAPRLLEIGFGSGQSLLALAKAAQDKDFIGVETHKPGIGALLLGIQSTNLSNVRVFYGDVVDVLEQCIPHNSLDGIQIFFPDPWQKRRHHLRRLIQPHFVSLLTSKLVSNGTLHLATDWEDYAIYMMRVLSNENELINEAGDNQYASRSPYRPLLTKFERRAAREGRLVWELQFARKSKIKETLKISIAGEK